MTFRLENRRNLTHRSEYSTPVQKSWKINLDLFHVFIADIEAWTLYDLTESEVSSIIESQYLRSMLD
jgi:hypothetical protein